MDPLSAKLLRTEDIFYDPGDLCAMALGDRIGRPFHHDPAHVLRTGITDEHAAIASEFRLDALDHRHHFRYRGYVGFSFDVHIYQFLGIYVHKVGEFRKALACPHHAGDELKGCDYSIPCCMVIEEYHVARFLAANDTAEPQHIFKDVPVADFGRMVRKTVFLARNAKAEIAHDRADNQVVFQLPLVGKQF